MRTSPLRAAILLSLLGGCTTVNSETGACPPLKAYPATDQARAAEELAGLPAGSGLAGLITDYGIARDQIRACRGGGS